MNRLNALKDAFGKKGFDAYLVINATNQLYLTGVSGIACTLIAGRGRNTILVYNVNCEQAKADAKGFVVEQVERGESLMAKIGAYYVEYLTNEIEERAIKYIERIDSLGGAVSAIEKGFMQHEITDSAYRNQKQIETKERVVVGVNDFVSQQQAPIRLLQIDPSIEKSLTQKLRETKKTRNKSGVDEELNELRKKAEAKDKENLIPYMLKAVKKYATLGEICEVLREVFGEYKAPSIF